MRSLVTNPALKSYFSDKERLADFINGTAYNGRQVLSSTDIEKYPSEAIDVIISLISMMFISKP